MRDAIEAHLRSRQVSRVIYGAIVGLALVVALQAHPPSPGVVVGTLLGTAVAVGLAELYSEVIGTEMRTREPVRRADIRPVLAEVVAVGCGVGFPAIFFILAAAGAIEVETAFTIAKWTGLGVIGLYGFLGARLTGASTSASLVRAVAVALIGGLLIALKALIH